MAGLGADELRILFTQEAAVRLPELSQLLLELEQSPGDETLIRSVFRELHTLKGSAAMAGLTVVSDAAHELEEIVEGLRAGQSVATPEVIDALLAGTDQLSALVATEPAPTAADARAKAATPRLDRRAHSESPGPDVEPALHAARAVPSGAALPPLAAVGTAGGRAAPGKTAGAVIMVPTERLEELTRLVGQAASAQLRIGQMLKGRYGIDPDSHVEYSELSRTLNDLQERATRTQMVPVSTVSDQLQRAVRDLARAQGKEIRWEARGMDTEMDRGVLHQLADSLLHLVRNSVDHGIESPDERVAADKPRHGTICVHAMQLGSDVIITVTDDGRGIDTAGVVQRAALQGVDTDGLSEDDLLALTFHPGLSTSAEVTDLSGRGVGLDVVRTKVEAARGRVEVRSERGGGTEYRIIVPITLAVLRCLLVEAGGQRYALPFHRVVLSQAADKLRRLHSEGRPIIWADGRPVPLAGLLDTLRPGSASDEAGPIVVLADSSRRHAFQVDRLIGQRDVVLKTLNPLLPTLPAVAGASVEPDGSVLIVLDPPSLIHRASLRPRANAMPATTTGSISGQVRPRILVVDDALTVRELQRSILERAGFQVRVAVDGRDAMAKLAEHPSELVLTDIEMPVMDGFALTQAIRAHPTLTNTPVLILSSRSSEADRQRGLDIGADGYIVKSGFDESALLGAVDRLLGQTA